MQGRTLAAVAAMAMACGVATRAQAVLMYSFEAPAVNPDGFGPNGGGITVAQDTIGATDGPNSLKVTVVPGATFVGALTENASPTLSDPALNGFGFDVTLTDRFTGGFALIGVTIFGASQPGPGQQFGLQAQFDQFKHLDGLAPGTYHFDLTNVTATNPLTFIAAQTPAQLFGSGADQLIPTGFQLFFNKSNDASVTAYVDNVTGIVPEPASAVSAVVLGALATVRRRRSA